MPTVNFIFDAKRELDTILFFEKEFGQLVIPDTLRAMLADAPKATEEIKGTYREEVRQQYIEGWKRIEERYFTAIEKVTGRPWLHDTYTVVLTAYMTGFCNPFQPQTNEVTARHTYPAGVRNYIIAHELFHSHYFNLIAENKDASILFSTELNENRDILALCYSEVKPLVIPEEDHIIDAFVASHAGAAPYFPALLRIWNERKDFADYLERSVGVLK